MLKRVLIILLIVVFVVSLGLIGAGCKKVTSEASAVETIKGAETTKVETTVATSAKEELKDVKIGISMYTLSAPYFAAQMEAAQKKAESLGMTVFTADAGDDMNKQLADVEDLLAKGIDILILNPKDPKGLIPATVAAKEAGVPVIIIDSSIDNSAEYVTTIQSDNMANGELVGNWLVNAMKGARIKMALLSGSQGNPVGKERRQGVFRGIIEEQLRQSNTAGFDIVSQGWGAWSTDGGLKAAEDILVAQKDFNVFLGENDSMMLGAMKAIKEAGRDKDILILAAADGQKEAYQAIKEGTYGATGLNNPKLIAETAVDVAVRLINGETGLARLTLTPPACISKENVDEFYDPNSVF